MPSAPVGTERTEKPISAAVAGLVPCADSGTSTTLRVAPSPRAAIAALIAIMPHNSPWAPAFGDMAIAGMPVIAISVRARSSISSKRALHGGGRLQRMNVGEPRQARHFLVEPRIVFHRA